ncbi:unnamed protein product [Clonostachys rosea]|uniref:Major facilitator superfamily (MFS) profile domain-containing protein n=1 Tax=Bionectria ochroleuca TaxID=29856 RepID=A0ABY6UMM0_BIOOC|nr:unnamed protein product [Clonostachys rosea]
MLRFLRDNNRRVTKHITSNLLLATMSMAFSVFTFGFEQAVFDTVQAMTPFERRFGDFLESEGQYGFTASKLAYLNSFPLISYAIGVVVASQIGERFGRKPVFIGMNFICMTGLIVVLTAKSYGQILAGRMILNLHVGTEAWLVPMYQAELVPAAVRGSFVSLYAFNHIFAGFICSIITNFTSNIPTDACWMIPVGCTVIFPSLVLSTCWLVPESPRWLLRKGRVDKATENIFYLSGTSPDYPAHQEAALLLEALQEGQTKGEWSDLIKGINLRRTIHGVLASAFTQLTGQSFASQYGSIFLKSINVMNAFTATMIKRALLCIGCLAVIFFVDKTGRRRMFLVGSFITAAALMVMGGLGTVAPSTMGIKKGIVAMALVFPATYMNSFAATLQVFKSEVPHITLRDKSVMVFWSVANLCNFVATFTLPYLLQAPYANLGSKVGFIYGSIATLGFIWGYCFLPEMAGRSLEEIDEMFESKVPAWRSRGMLHLSSAGNTVLLTQSTKQAPLEEVEERVEDISSQSK